MGMKEAIATTQGTGRKLVPILLLSAGLATGPVFGQEENDTTADDILKTMSAYLGGLESFRVNADIDLEIITHEGQKLQYSSYAVAWLRRPDKLHIERKGLVGDVNLTYDGKRLTLYEKGHNVYAQLEQPGTVDDAILAFELETGITAPGADMLFSNPYTVLSGGVEQGVHLGSVYIDGIKCDHLAFREDNVDWQLWVQSGDTPLPMKYVITSKWHTAAPQYAIRFRGWELNPDISTDTFEFSPPANARKLDALELDDVGELAIPEEIE
jgi:hypothetical protein